MAPALGSPILPAARRVAAGLRGALARPCQRLLTDRSNGRGKRTRLGMMTDWQPASKGGPSMRLIVLACALVLVGHLEAQGPAADTSGGRRSSPAPASTRS